MQEMVPATEDAGSEKHLPVVTGIDDCKIRIDPISDRRYTVVGDLGQAEVSLTERTIIVRPRWSKETVTYQIPEEEGGHGGADPNLLEAFIKVVTGVLPNTSTTEHGMMSTAVGQAAELSRRENRTVFIDELFK